MHLLPLITDEKTGPSFIKEAREFAYIFLALSYIGLTHIRELVQECGCWLSWEVSTDGNIPHQVQHLSFKENIKSCLELENQSRV